ncbi:MAG: amidohydrolase family protein [Bryobacteraceae bacterium]
MPQACRFLAGFSALLIAACLPAQPTSATVVYKVRKLIDPASGKVVENASIVVAGGRILDVSNASSATVPAGAKVDDFGDRYIIPGLIDTHGHLYSNLINGHSSNEALPRLWLAGGVTSVLAPGSFNPEGDIAIRNRIDSGALPGSRFFLAGEYLQMSPPETGMAPIRTPAEAKLRIELWASRGISAVKLYNGMQGEIMRTAVAYAHEHGLRVLAHLGATTYQEAIDSGVDVIYHGAYAFPEIQPKDMPAEAVGMIHFAPPEFDKYYEALVTADLAQPRVAAVMRSAARSAVVFAPTLVALEPPNMTVHHMEEQRKYFSPEAWKKVEGRATAVERPYARKLLEKNLEFTRDAHAAGVRLALGTDLTNLQQLPEFGLWREMELFAEAGLTPMEILRCATVNGAFAIGKSHQIGSLEPGKLADFVVLDADPLAHISAVRSVYRVVKSGVVYEPDALLKPAIGKIH